MVTWDLFYLEDEFSDFTPFFAKFNEKKWKFGVKIAYGNFGYYSLVTWMLRIYPVFLEFTDQMGNRGKDGVWELNVLGTCRWIRRINPVSQEFIEQKWRIGLKIGYGNLGSIQFGGWILRFYPVFLEFVEKNGKSGYGYFGHYPLVAWMLRVYLVFLKFTDQMENRGKDGIWKLRVLATCGLNS